MTPQRIGERAANVALVRADADAPKHRISSALVDVRAIRAWADAQEAGLIAQLSTVDAFPEATIADTNRCSLGTATKTRERADTLAAIPTLADALGDGAITAGHIDAVTRSSKKLDDDTQREEFLGRANELAGVAAAGTVDQFAKRLELEIKKLQSDDGEDRLTRQRRNTRLSTWVDVDGMWNLRGRFDPLTGARLASRLDATVNTLFAEHTPELCPTDPVEKNKFLTAHALARHLGVAPTDLEHPTNTGDTNHPAADDSDASPVGDKVPGSDNDTADSTGTSTTGTSATDTDDVNTATPDHDVAASADAVLPAPTPLPSSRRPEMIIVIDADAPNRPGPVAEFSIPIELPARVIAELADAADIHTVIVRNGVILHAPGNLDLGRGTRLANRAQRRALRALYPTCAIPGCTTHYDRCKLHHIIWWRHGGHTDLHNLLPVCAVHHSKIHNNGWTIELGPNRQLTLTLPDGTIRSTGPHSRQTAA